MMERITGTCPACGGRDTLFVADGGFITCGRSDCPYPGVVADVLLRPAYHVIEIGEDGWALQHAITCFPDLLDCETHRAVSVWAETLSGPPAPVGRYRLSDDFGIGPFKLIPMDKGASS